MNRTAGWVLGVAAVQAALVAFYVLVERTRAPEAVRPLSTQPPRRIDMAMPSLLVVGRDGTRGELRLSGRRTLVHVWATWCPPCRAELPGLLELATRYDIAVVAVALDPSWDDLARFFGELERSNLVLGVAEEIERSLGVRALPVTFLVEPDGRVTLRFDGARDWTNDEFVQGFIAAGSS